MNDNDWVFVIAILLSLLIGSLATMAFISGRMELGWIYLQTALLHKHKVEVKDIAAAFGTQNFSPFKKAVMYKPEQEMSEDNDM